MLECCCFWTVFFTFIIGYWVIKRLLERLEVDDLENKAVFITGCDSGFGRESALKLANKGCPVFAGCLTEEGIKSIESEAKGMKGKLVGVPLNILDDDSVQKAVEFVKSKLPRGIKLWSLLNNAGVFTTYGPSEWCSIDEYKTGMELNFYGAVRCTHAFLPLLKQSKGRIGSTTSVSGRLGTPGASPYSSAKFALSAYVEAISVELDVFGIKCGIFEPGVFKTDLLNKEAKNKRVNFAWNKMSQELRDEYGESYKEKFLSNWHKIMDMVGTKNTNYVTDAYVHFVTSKYPRFRYQCGWDSILVWCPISCLPTEWISFIWKPRERNDPAAIANKKYN